MIWLNCPISRTKYHLRGSFYMLVYKRPLTFINLKKKQRLKKLMYFYLIYMLFVLKTFLVKEQDALSTKVILYVTFTYKLEQDKNFYEIQYHEIVSKWPKYQQKLTMTGNHSNSFDRNKFSNLKQHNDHKQRTHRWSRNNHGIFERRKSRKGSKTNNAISKQR